MQQFDNIFADVKTQAGFKPIGCGTLFTVRVRGKTLVRSCVAKPEPGEPIACQALRSDAENPCATYGETEFYQPRAIVDTSSLREFRSLSGLQPA